MKNLQKTLLLVLSMVSTQAVESTSDAGDRMMRKQACVSSLSAFLTDSEKMGMQLLNKRVYKIREHVMPECSIELTPGTILRNIEKMDGERRDKYLKSLRDMKFSGVGIDELEKLQEVLSLEASDHSELGCNVKIISHEDAQKEIEGFTSRLENHKRNINRWEYHMPIPNKNGTGCDVVVSETPFSNAFSERKLVSCAQWQGNMPINERRKIMTEIMYLLSPNCTHTHLETLIQTTRLLENFKNS